MIFSIGIALVSFRFSEATGLQSLQHFHRSFLCSSAALMRLHPHSSNALSSNRLIASDRDGFGSGWRSIQASSFACRSAGMRKPRIGSRPVRGRPRGLFGLSAIDPPLFLA